jgi:hypothetical protein
MNIDLSKYNCYNIAIKYLKNKYGEKNNALTYNTPSEEIDICINRLLEQYYYGYTVRFELYNILVALNIIIL